MGTRKSLGMAAAICAIVVLVAALGCGAKPTQQAVPFNKARNDLEQYLSAVRGPWMRLDLALSKGSTGLSILFKTKYKSKKSASTAFLIGWADDILYDSRCYARFGRTTNRGSGAFASSAVPIPAAVEHNLLTVWANDMRRLEERCSVEMEARVRHWQGSPNSQFLMASSIQSKYADLESAACEPYAIWRQSILGEAYRTGCKVPDWVSGDLMPGQYADTKKAEAAIQKAIEPSPSAP